LERKRKKNTSPPRSQVITPVRPEVIQTILLDEIAGRLAEIQEFLRKMEPKGFIIEREEKVVGIDGIWIDFVEEYPYTLLFSATFYNKGTERVYIAINQDLAHPFYLDAKDREIVNFRFPKLRYVRAWCEKGKETILKIVGGY